MGPYESIRPYGAEIGPLIDGRWVELVVLVAILLTTVLATLAVLLLVHGLRRRGG